MQSKTQERHQIQLESAKEQKGGPETTPKRLKARRKTAKKLPSYRLRYIISMCLLTTYSIGRFYINDYVPELGPDFMKYFKITPAQVQLFCAIYSFPAIVTALLSGPIIARFGASKVAAFGGFVIFLATSGYYLSVIQKDFRMLLDSQILFGVIGEVFAVSQNTLLTQTFDENGQTIAFGISQSLNTLFETASNYLNPKIYAWTEDMPLVFLMGVIVTGFCFVASLLWLMLDKIAGWGSLQKNKDGTENQAGEVNEEEVDELKDLKLSEKVKVWWSDLKDPLVALNVLMTSIAQYNYYQIMTYVTECMVRRFNLKLEQANKFVALMLFLTIPSSQIYSYLAVGIGRKPSMLILGCLFLTIFLLLFLLLPENPNHNLFYITSFLFSQFYSISTAIGFSCIGIVTPPRTVSVAYSLVSFINNFTFCILPFVVGMILKDNAPSGYQKVNFMVLMLSLVGLGMAIGVKVIDSRRGGLLALPEKKKETKQFGGDDGQEGDGYALKREFGTIGKVGYDDGATMSLQPTTLVEKSDE